MGLGCLVDGLESWKPWRLGTWKVGISGLGVEGAFTAGIFCGDSGFGSIANAGTDGLGICGVS